ncbi:hypothetical protein NZ35_26230 [Pseudomonas chlororaphis]|uniref:RING-type E3 ubiquitin transferase n=1 Tax=Pseudomonas chlororaphis TaxID=587753 RepID=A0A0A6D6R2_9PSED|nr:hypothetical protein NZ35_26230 [Pseudomonas chlororaphis]
MLESSAVLRDALYASLKASYKSRHLAREQAKTLSSPQRFCTPLLAKAMTQKLGEPFDVAGAIFQHVRSTSSLLGLRKKLVLPIQRDLLAAACENFELAETKSGNYSETSFLYIPERVTGKRSRILPLKPHEFAELCRDLDLGAQYQKHVEDLFGSDSQTGSLQAVSVTCSKDQFDVDRHIALMRGHISADVYAMLESVKDSTSRISLGNNTLGYHNLEMLGVTLRGPMLIGPVGVIADDDERCVVYIPGDPDHPLKEYTSFSMFERQLSMRLRDVKWRGFFMRFILLGERSTFMTGLNVRLLNASATQFPFATFYLPLTTVSPEGDAKSDLFVALFQHHAKKVRAESRLLVVPTGDEDEKARLTRLESYKSIGLDTLAFFASFVPVLGEMMFAVAGLQLLGEIYEGVESWAHGDQEHATDCLFDTLENLILMTAFAAGGVTAGKAYKTVRSSSFVQGLRRLPIAGNAHRLWRPDMAAYRQTEPVLAGLSTDSQGLIWQGAERYLPLGAEAYAVRPVSGTGLWEVCGTPASTRYKPLLETNGEGAWRHDSELAQGWSPLKLLRRLGYPEAGLPDARALQVIACIGIDETQLRLSFVQRGETMAILSDTVRRFHADAQVSQFLQQIVTPSLASSADADLQLYLLTTASRWPADLAVIVKGAGPGDVARYGVESASRHLELSKDALRQGQYHAALLAGLKADETSHLLGSPAGNASGQIALLIGYIGGLAQRQRAALMSRLYRRVDVCEIERGEAICTAFSPLSASIADELVRHADVNEWAQLDSARVPLRLAEEARRYQTIQRLNRAYEGLYLDAVNCRDADRLLLDTLTHLPGWPGDVSVEIAEAGGSDTENYRVGPIDASYKVIIEGHTEGYQGLETQGSVVSTRPARTRADFFQTLCESLPVHARKALGVAMDTDGSGLRQKITALALQRREAFSNLLSGKTLHADYRSPMGLADRQVVHSMGLSAPDTSPLPSRSPAIMQRAAELYPSHSTEQIKLFVASLEADDVLAIRTLERMRVEYQTMVEALERWIHRDTWYHTDDGVRERVPSHSKSRASQAIQRAWRRETRMTHVSGDSAHSLTLDSVPLGDLPVIVADFSHVAVLQMRGVGASAGLNTFLRNFPRLSTLELSGNGLTRIPQAIEDMSALRHLDLRENRIEFTDRSDLEFSNNDALVSLDLSLNRTLGRAPRIAAQRRLRRLDLRACGIAEWPSDIDALTHLQTLDLRNNNIVEVPAAVFKYRSALNRGTNIDGNPLSAASLEAIAQYQRAQGIGLGVMANDYPGTAWQAADKEGARWVKGLSQVPIARAQEVLTSLLAEPQSGDFFEMLEQLRATADFTRTRDQLAQRVWNVLEAMCADARLRRTLFRMARAGQPSAVNVAGLFSELEVRFLCYRAAVAPRTATQTLEGELIGLLRGLFRLHEVQRHALIEVALRAQSGPFTAQQALDISLLYRVRLAERLQLPGQPRQLNATLSVEVSAGKIDQVCLEVIRAEQGSQLLESISQEEFWSEYLLTTQRAAFEDNLQRSERSLAQLERQAGLTRQAASQQMKTIMDNFRNEGAQVRRRLTTQALSRHPGLTLPTTTMPGRFDQSKG